MPSHLRLPSCLPPRLSATWHSLWRLPSAPCFAQVSFNASASMASSALFPLWALTFVIAALGCFMEYFSASLRISRQMSVQGRRGAKHHASVSAGEPWDEVVWNDGSLQRDHCTHHPSMAGFTAPNSQKFTAQTQMCPWRTRPPTERNHATPHRATAGNSHTKRKPERTEPIRQTQNFQKSNRRSPEHIQS